MEHHKLDVYPLPKDKSPVFINEPCLVDETLSELLPRRREPEPQPDNIRIYVPVDINRDAVLRRLEGIIRRYGEASEENESDFRADVYRIISQIEIYDQIWYVRHMPSEGKHSLEALDLVREVVRMLRSIPDACVECFPNDVIGELLHEYGS